MVTRSAGLMLYRRKGADIEVMLVHPGGPFWESKDLGVWSMPKGVFETGESSFAAAKREFAEEVGAVPEGTFIQLGRFEQPSGKVIHAWAVESDFDAASLKCNTFSMEWPPHSGRMQEFPEVDRAHWFGPEDARRKIVPGQIAILDELFLRLGARRADKSIALQSQA